MDNDIFAILDELENYVENAKKVPLTNQLMVDRASLLNLVQTIRDSLPEAIKNGSRIVGQESRILQDAKKNYENLSAEAEAKAKKLRMESEQQAQAVMNNATRDANLMIADAHRQADAIIEAAKREAEMKVAQSTVVANAEKKANEILSNAHGEAVQLRTNVMERCLDLLKHCENEAILVANELRDARIQIEQER